MSTPNPIHPVHLLAGHPDAAESLVRDTVDASRQAGCDHPWHRNPGLITPCPQCGEGACEAVDASRVATEYRPMSEVLRTICEASSDLGALLIADPDAEVAWHWLDNLLHIALGQAKAEERARKR